MLHCFPEILGRCRFMCVADSDIMGNPIILDHGWIVHGEVGGALLKVRHRIPAGAQGIGHQGVRLGHGNAAYLSLNEPAEPVMKGYFDRISHPALANVKVSFGNMKVSEVYPQRIPELFVGRPIIITGKFTGALSKMIVKLRATVGTPARLAVGLILRNPISRIVPPFTVVIVTAPARLLA